MHNDRTPATVSGDMREVVARRFHDTYERGRSDGYALAEMRIRQKEVARQRYDIEEVATLAHRDGFSVGRDYERFALRIEM